jgi:hypothetical protein
MLNVDSSSLLSPEQGCQIILETIYQNREKCTNDHKITKWTQYIPNGHNFYQHFPFQGLPKCTQIGFIGLKIYHLATLVLKLHFYVFPVALRHRSDFPHLSGICFFDWQNLFFADKRLRIDFGHDVQRESDTG